MVGADRAAKSQEKSAKRAMQSQERQTDKSIAFQREMYEQQREDMMPWLETGEEYLSLLSDAEKRGDFDPGTFQFSFSKDDPSYQFRFDEGMKAIDNAMSARGLDMSGTQYKNLMRFGQDAASQEYQAEFGRDLAEFNANKGTLMDKYNRMAGLGNTGMVAAQTVGGYGSNLSNQVGGAMRGLGNAMATGNYNIGNARASGYQDMTTAMNQGVGNAILWHDVKNRPNPYTPSQPAAGGTP
jgi:hypothetical protein